MILAMAPHLSFRQCIFCAPIVQFNAQIVPWLILPDQVPITQKQVHAGAYPSACAGEGTYVCVCVHTHVHLQVDTPVLAYGRASQGVQCNSKVKVRAMGGWSQLRTRCICPCAVCNAGCALCR